MRCIIYTMKRTQLYLDEEEFATLEILARQRRKSLSQLVREAIRTTYFRRRTLDPKRVLEESKGLWKGRKDLPPTDEQIRRLRSDTRRERSK